MCSARLLIVTFVTVYLMEIRKPQYHCCFIILILNCGFVVVGSTILSRGLHALVPRGTCCFTEDWGASYRTGILHCRGLTVYWTGLAVYWTGLVVPHAGFRYNWKVQICPPFWRLPPPPPHTHTHTAGRLIYSDSGKIEPHVSGDKY